MNIQLVDKLKNTGFSLVELMVIMALIAIILGISIPLYQDSVKKSNVAKMVSKLQSLQGTVAENYIQTGSYPTTLDGVAKNTVTASTDFPFVTNFFYNTSSYKGWFGYQLNSEYGSGWVFMLMMYDAGLFHVYCGTMVSTTCANGSYGACNSAQYLPAGCNWTDLSTYSV